MADEAQLNPFVFALQGGLVLDRSTFTMEAGMAFELENFEPDPKGGYRRINGFSKWNDNIVPQTSSSGEAVLMSAFFKGNVIAARGEKVFKGATTGSWTEIDSGRTSAGKYSSFRYNLDGTDFIVWADGANHASVYDNSTVTDLNSTGAPANPKFVSGFKNHLFFAGMSATPQRVTFAAPEEPTNFTPAKGAGFINFDGRITGLFPFRDALYIFCEESIFKIVGEANNFSGVPVTRELGCKNGDTIQELAGDLIFLGPDGLRTIAGTEKLGDVALGTISSAIQQRFVDETTVADFDSVVIPEKTQYRIFFTKSAGDSKKGVICVRKADKYEFSEFVGIRPSCTDSAIFEGASYVLHGTFDGYIQRQEQSNTFDGTTIVGRYRSPDLTMGDAGIRKNFQRAILNYSPSGTVNADLIVRYDYESSDVPRPAAYPFDSTSIVALYGSSTYGSATYGGQSEPLFRQPIEGSGFAVALRVVDSGVSSPYSLKGFQLEFDAGARR